MTTAGFAGSALLVLVSLIAIGLPLLQSGTRRRDDSQRVDVQREHLLRFYEQCVASIRDLDDDYAEGKLLEADYAADRERWVQRGVQVLQALHELQTTHIPLDEMPETTDVGALDAAIEDMIAQAQVAHA